MFSLRSLPVIALTLSLIILSIACGGESDTNSAVINTPAPQVAATEAPPSISPTAVPTEVPTVAPTAVQTEAQVEPDPVTPPMPGLDPSLAETDISGTFEVAGETKSVVIESGTDGSVIKEGDIIKTGSTEEVTTDITVGSTIRKMRTSPDTEWTVGDAEETGAVVIELKRGELKIVDDGFGYFPMQVDTPTGSVLLRGTWVLVRVLGDGSTEVECVKGPCQYLDENSMSVVVADGGTVRATTDAAASGGIGGWEGAPQALVLTARTCARTHHSTTFCS